LRLRYQRFGGTWCLHFQDTGIERIAAAHFLQTVCYVSTVTTRRHVPRDSHIDLMLPNPYKHMARNISRFALEFVSSSAGSETR
jgi:hypothetical protein